MFTLSFVLKIDGGEIGQGRGQDLEGEAGSERHPDGVDDPAGPGDVVGHEDPRPDEDDAAQEPSHRRGGAGGGEGRGRDAQD